MLISICFCKYVYLFRPLVQPSTPVLGSHRDIGVCTNCTVAEEGHSPSVQCKSTGTISVVALQIGKRKNCTFVIEPDGVHTRFTNNNSCTVSNEDHGQQLKCVVTNKAVPGGLVSEPQTLYVLGKCSNCCLFVQRD